MSHFNWVFSKMKLFEWKIISSKKLKIWCAWVQTHFAWSPHIWCSAEKCLAFLMILSSFIMTMPTNLMFSCCLLTIKCACFARMNLHMILKCVPGSMICTISYVMTSVIYILIFKYLSKKIWNMQKCQFMIEFYRWQSVARSILYYLLKIAMLKKDNKILSPAWNIVKIHVVPNKIHPEAGIGCYMW